QILAFHSLKQRTPHLLLCKDKDVIVWPAGGAAVYRARHGRTKLIACPLHRFAKALMIAQAHADEIDDRLLHRDLHLLTFASRVALHERSEDADHHMHARAGIANTGPREGRGAVCKSGDAHSAAHSLRDWLIAFVFAMRPIRAEPFDAGVDETRIYLF